jgi:hypothetical protein
MAVAGGVLPVGGIDSSAVSCGPFYPQRWVEGAGGRAGGIVTPDCLALVLASVIRIVGSRPGMAGRAGVVGLVGQV